MDVSGYYFKGVDSLGKRCTLGIQRYLDTAHGLRGQIRVQMMAFLLKSSVTLGKVVNHTEPSHLQSEDLRLGHTSQKGHAQYCKRERHKDELVRVKMSS